MSNGNINLLPYNTCCEFYLCKGYKPIAEYIFLFYIVMISICKANIG